MIACVILKSEAVLAWGAFSDSDSALALLQKFDNKFFTDRKERLLKWKKEKRKRLF